MSPKKLVFSILALFLVVVVFFIIYQLVTGEGGAAETSWNFGAGVINDTMQSTTGSGEDFLNEYNPANDGDGQSVGETNPFQ